MSDVAVACLGSACARVAEVRRAARCLRRRAFRSNCIRPISMSAALRRTPARRCRRQSPRCWRARKLQWSPDCASRPAGARRRPDSWRSAASVFPSPPIARRPARSFARCPAAPMSFIRPIAFVQDATVLFEHVGIGAADDARILRSASSIAISTPSEARRRRASAPIRSKVLAFSFSSGWKATISPSSDCRCSQRSIFCAGADASRHEQRAAFHSVPDRLARHGQIADRAVFCRTGRAGSRFRCRRACAL